jgi:hypothetical protein
VQKAQDPLPSPGTALAGIPVSTTHTITGAIVGVGAVQRLSAVRWGVAGRIVWAWVLKRFLPRPASQQRSSSYFTFCIRHDLFLIPTSDPWVAAPVPNDWR